MNLAAGLTDRGHAVDVVLAAAEGTYLSHVPPGARVVDLGAGRMRRSLRPLVRYLQDARPRAIVCSMDHTNVAAVWARRIARVPTRVVATVHNTLSQSTPALQRLVWASLIRAFYPWADAVVAVSRGVADDLARETGLARRRIEVIYNPVITPESVAAARREPRHPWLRDGGPPVILGVGRLTRQKDFATLLRAFAAVRSLRPVRLIILGEGEDRAGLEALARELGVAADVDLPGFVPDSLAFMAHASVFVLSSAWEGLPTVLIEALAAGGRVVSTDCESGPREILQEGRLGALVPVADAAALGAAVAGVLDRPPPPATVDALRPYTRDAAVEHYLRVIDAGVRP